MNFVNLVLRDRNWSILISRRFPVVTWSNFLFAIVILSSLTLSLLNLCVVVSNIHLVLSALIAILFVSHQSSTFAASELIFCSTRVRVLADTASVLSSAYISSSVFSVSRASTIFRSFLSGSNCDHHQVFSSRPLHFLTSVIISRLTVIFIAPNPTPSPYISTVNTL